MGTGQLLFVLFAVILFSTLFLTYYNGIIEQAETIYNTNYYLQGLQIVEKIYQSIMASIISETKDFSQIYTEYSSLENSISVEGQVYHYNISSSYCDSLGIDVGSSSNFQRLDFKIYTVKGNQDTIFIGTESAPITKMLAKIQIN
ncbi:MAG: hypothetical protein PWQ09_179 [Candidatus Cloacimonadota bacterium]|jgi:hypothetical protein|nr:hypothetical protein [Candidatus Cloacimonadota bacterium]